MARRSMAVTLAALLGAATAAGATKDTATKAPPAPKDADLTTVLAAVREPGASAVLVNVWATWCDPCRDEMPEILRFYRNHRAGGLRLVLVSADDPDNRPDVARFLAKSGAQGALTFIKTGDDMAFINGLDAHWTGALPASFLFDGGGKERHFWPGQVTYRDLEDRLVEMAAQRTDPINNRTKGHP